MFSLFVISENFILKCKGLCDARVVSITQSLKKNMASISNEWLNGWLNVIRWISCLTEIFKVKYCVKFSLTFFDTAK